MDVDGKAERVGEVDGPVHRVYRAVSDVEQGGCVIEAQIPDKQVGWGERQVRTGGLDESGLMCSE